MMVLTTKDAIKRGIGKIVRPHSFISKHEIPVFMFHRIVEDNQVDQHLDKSTFLTKSQFVKAIDLIKDNFEVLCLKKIIESGLRPIKRSCIITFDDGWIDNYQIAFPILKANKLPATIFVPTGFIGTSKQFWFKRLSDIISAENLDKKEILFKAMNLLNINKNVSEFDIDKKYLYFLVSSKLKNFRQPEIDQFLDRLEAEFGTNVCNKDERTILNWEELKEMSSENISFGSHGVTHSILPHLDTSEKIVEILKSRDDLLGKRVNFVNAFSFPNGNYDQESLDISAQVGYLILFSASINKCGVGKSSILVHRINVSSGLSENDMLSYTLLKAKIKNRLYQPRKIKEMGH